MSLIFFNKPCYVIFVEYFFGVLTNSELFEQIELCRSQRNTLCGEQLVHHIFPNVAKTLRIEDFECVEESLSSGGLKFV